MRTYILIAFIGSFLVALAIHTHECRVGTYEQCLMSRGMFWVLWVGLFFIIWFLAAVIGAAIKSAREEKSGEQ
jgi:hypothetical protein